ncbi:MAG: imidazoleglycerol-phosphate dehydratase HisB [Aquificota bacterium]|jgi:imidazoleglycerol-phosphate dehydratase
MERVATVRRTTKETDIEIYINLDGKGNYDVQTPIGFLNHMLESFAKHGRFDLKVKATGDVHVSHHHLVEDAGITLGMAVRKALGSAKGIKRYGWSIVPMDEALVISSLDISGRGLFYHNKKNLRGKITEFDFELIWEFFKGFALESRSTLHIKVERGYNLHHIAEACFKSFAFTLKDAVTIIGGDIPSTKGAI